jgi:hypothetical protein
LYSLDVAKVMPMLIRGEGGLVSIFVGGAGGYGGPDCRICGGTAGLAAE